MRGLLIAAASLAAAFLILRLIGSRISRSHCARSRILLAHPIAMVWAVVRNQQDVAIWWPEVKKVDRLPDQVGRERWRQTLGNNFSMTLVIAESVPPRRMRTVIDAEPGAAFGGTWTYELSPSGEGTEVKISEESWLANPFFRLFAKLMGHHRTIDSYLRALARRFGETAQPSHLL
ncbi:MAG: SRPBCC domain-containing protein [Gemmatimonadota bacterium]